MALALLLRPFLPKFVAQAEISSLRTNDRFYRLDVTQQEGLDTGKSEVDDGTKVLRAFGAESAPNDGNETQSGLEHEAAIGSKTAPNSPSRVQIPAEKCDHSPEDIQGRPEENLMFENTFPDAGKRARRSAGATHAETVDRSTSGDAQRSVETVQGVSNPRAEYRRSGEETRGSNPRQSEPHLDTSTFALSGDSAHNQAMVHWSGHNSSVSTRCAPALRTERIGLTQCALTHGAGLEAREGGKG